jgi:integrase
MGQLDYTTSIYKVESTGRWMGELRGPTVKRQRVVGSRKGDVRAKLDKLIAARGRLPVHHSDMILRDWVSWWLENINASKSPRNADHNKWALNQLGGITAKRLRDLEPTDVEAELTRLATRPRPKRRTRGTNKGPLSRSSLVKVRRALAAVLTEAQKRRLVSWNVAALSSIPPGAKPPVPRRALSTDEATALIETASEDEQGKYHPLIVVALYCGLRPGEVTGLPWKAVDLGKGTLTVFQSRKVGPDSTMTIGATKAHSDRVLALPRVVQEVLRAHEARQGRDRKEAPVWENNGLVFCNEIGRPIDPSNLRRIVQRLCVKAEVKPISPNELRHTAATLLVEAGMRLEDVADFLGHKDTTMLATVYRHKTKRVVDLTVAQEQMFQVGG